MGRRALESVETGRKSIAQSGSRVHEERDLLARARRPEAARRPLRGPCARTELRRTLCSDIGIYEDTDTCIGVPHFLATRYLRRTGITPHSQFPNGIVSSVSFVSTTNTARSLAGFVLLSLALTPWRSPGSSEKLCPAS